MQRSTASRAIILAGLASAIGVGASRPPGSGDGGGEAPLGNYVVFAFNDLGMHCMNDDFSELVILPPYNNLRAQVIRRKSEPDIMDSASDVTVSYRIPSNTHSADKTNFWTWSPAVFGPLPSDVGLAGKGLSGTMDYVGQRRWEATGIPLTPYDDTGELNPYPLATVTALTESGQTATTVAVVPVSSEMSCNQCHGGDGVSPAHDVLVRHDAMHGTDLVNQKPVLCAGCHADVALGAPGQPGVPSLSSAIHTAHADDVGMLALDNHCYACHPGQRTQCQRDVHFTKGVTCIECHGDMAAVGDPLRKPWEDEPRCGDCHSKPGFDFEQPGKLFKESVGHGGVMCATCHGSPHAIGPAATAADNQQMMLLQGHAGPLDNCTVCHVQTPGEPFFHKIDD